MPKSLSEILDETPFESISIVNAHTGCNVSIEFELNDYSPTVFGVSATEAILKCIAKHAPKPAVTPLPATVPPPPY